VQAILINQLDIGRRAKRDAEPRVCDDRDACATN
jgi:hypothetical protein